MFIENTNQSLKPSLLSKVQNQSKYNLEKKNWNGRDGAAGSYVLKLS